MHLVGFALTVWFPLPCDGPEGSMHNEDSSLKGCHCLLVDMEFRYARWGNIKAHDTAVKWLEYVNTLLSFEGGHGKLPEVGWGDLFAHCHFVPSAYRNAWHPTGITSCLLEWNEWMA